MVKRTDAKKYFLQIIDDYQDPLTDEYNHCLMAEDAMTHFDVGLDDTNTQDDLNDWALEVVWFVENSQGSLWG